MKENLVLAPIKGYTDPPWRSVFFKYFGGFSKVVTPFLILSEERVPKVSYVRSCLPELGTDVAVTPQILGKNPDSFLKVAEVLKEIGVTEVNLNMGCPASVAVKKGRGSGLLKDLDGVKRFLDRVCSSISIDLTLKVRTGMSDHSVLLPLTELVNDYPIKEFIIHPRYAEQFYEGSPNRDLFEEACNLCRHPVSYNGDIYTKEDFYTLKERFPRVSSWMIGRGVLRDPWLALEIQGNSRPSPEEGREKLSLFLNELYGIFKELYPKEVTVTGRMKALFLYLAYNKSEEIVSGIKRAPSVEEMLRLLEL